MNNASKLEPLAFEIEFKSDFHVGAGHGLGPTVDSALLRDPDGIPVIRGTELTGLLRESLINLLRLAPFHEYRLCEASGAANGKAYCGQFEAQEPERICPVCALFGSNRRTKRWRFSSARPTTLERPQSPAQSQWRAGETAAQVTTRARINPRTRRAEENKLFSQEEGDGSLRYRFTAECLSQKPETWEEAMWLVAAARALRNMGAGKRRGRGECEIHLTSEKQQKQFLDWFETLCCDQKEPRFPASSEQNAIQPLALPAEPSVHGYRLTVLLRTDEPLLVAQRSETGNQFETLEMIPGSVVRGVLAWRVARRHDLDDPTSDAYRAFVDLFFRNALHVSALQPVQVAKNSHQGYPTIIAPRDLLTCELHPGFSERSRDSGHGVLGSVNDDVPDHCPVCAKSSDGNTKVKLESAEGFLPLRREGITVGFAPKRRVEMHISVDPKTGRVRTGDLFGYVSLEPGQYFVGEITCTDKSVWDTLRSLTGIGGEGEVNELRMGKASRRGHGKVSLIWRESDGLLWRGSSLTERVPSGEQVVLTLLSDAIVTDPWGRFVPGFDAAWLWRELELPEGVTVTVDKTAAGAERAFSAVRPVQSFNAKLGLPRPRDMALSAGSSVRLSFSGIDLADLQKRLAAVEQRGIGLRREEGFGRVAFNHPVYDKFANWQRKALDLSGIECETDAQGHDLARRSQFEQEWAEILDEKFDQKNRKKFAHPPFEAAARLLHVSPSGAEAADRLQAMGQSEQLLDERLEGRSKQNFYKEGDGKEGMEKIMKLLGSLKKLIDEQGVAPEREWQIWQIGLEMLADRVAEPARRKAEERR